uniref:Aftiphilin a n=1 Tax=Eptatretus burgeri TaxID=7764 RepID=A0A8C4WUM6_EPTBU
MDHGVLRVYSTSPPPLEEAVALEDDDDEDDFGDFGDFAGVDGPTDPFFDSGASLPRFVHFDSMPNRVLVEQQGSAATSCDVKNNNTLVMSEPTEQRVDGPALEFSISPENCPSASSSGTEGNESSGCSSSSSSSSSSSRSSNSSSGRGNAYCEGKITEVCIPAEVMVNGYVEDTEVCKGTGVQVRTLDVSKASLPCEESGQGDLSHLVSGVDDGKLNGAGGDAICNYVSAPVTDTAQNTNDDHFADFSAFGSTNVELFEAPRRSCKLDHSVDERQNNGSQALAVDLAANHFDQGLSDGLAGAVDASPRMTRSLASDQVESDHVVTASLKGATVSDGSLTVIRTRESDVRSAVELPVKSSHSKRQDAVIGDSSNSLNLENDSKTEKEMVNYLRTDSEVKLELCMNVESESTVVSSSCVEPWPALRSSGPCTDMTDSDADHFGEASVPDECIEAFGSALAEEHGEEKKVSLETVGCNVPVIQPSKQVSQDSNDFGSLVSEVQEPRQAKKFDEDFEEFGTMSHFQHAVECFPDFPTEGASGAAPNAEGWATFDSSKIAIDEFGAHDADHCPRLTETEMSTAPNKTTHLQGSESVSLLQRLERVFRVCFPCPMLPPIEEDIPVLHQILSGGPTPRQPSPDEIAESQPRTTESQPRTTESQPRTIFPTWPACSVWANLREPDEAFGLRYQWGGSHSNKHMLRALGIDTRNIGMLEPTKGIQQPMSAAEKIASIAQASSLSEHSEQNVTTEQTQDGAVAAQFDWNGSGLTNPLDVNGASSILNLDFFGPVDETTNSTQTTSMPGVDPELYELTRPTAPSTMSRVTDAFARLMSTADTTITRRPQKHENLSSETRTIIAGLPDLSFMKAKVLMFPTVLAPLPSGGNA